MAKLKAHHYLNVEHVAGNCYATLLFEFTGGHRLFANHAPKEPLSSRQWTALLRNSRDEMFGEIVLFGGTNSTISKNYPIGQAALAEYFRAARARVTVTKNKAYTWYSVVLPSKLRQKLNTGNGQSEYETSIFSGGDW